MSAFNFKELYNLSPIPIFIGQEGFFQLVNHQMVLLTGYTAEELYRIPILELIHSQDRDFVKNNALRRMAGEKILSDYEFRLIGNRGGIFHTRGFFSSIEYKGRPAILGQLIDITKQKQVEEVLKASEEKYRKVVDNANVAILVTQGGIIKFINPAVNELTGYSKEELISRPLLEFIHPDNQKVLVDRHFKMTNGELLSHMHSLRVITKKGKVKWLEINTVLFTWEGKPATLSFMNDITERKQAEEKLILQKAYFQQLFENSPEGIVILDIKEQIIDINTGFVKLFQYPVEEIKGRYLNDVIVPEHLAREAFSITSSVHSGEFVHKESVRKRKDGSLVDVSILGYPIVIDGVHVGVYAIYSDISERKRAEEQLKYLSLHDSLTGLCNRTSFEQLMRRQKDGDCAPASIILCDVDGLKLVNDTLGHSTGDALLRLAADVLKKSFRDGDMIARIGGDEFAVLLPQSNKKITENAVRRIRNAVARYNARNPELPLSISIGFAGSGKASPSIDDIFKEADNNMYREKLHRSQSTRSAIVQTLMKALEARDLITEGHAQRLQELVAILARAIGLPESKTTDLRLLAKFHDIGKVGIPDRILFKPGPLAPEERAEMRRHSEIGHRIAQSANDLMHIADWILKHHEWWNGEGYPLGLKGIDIPIECRILAIADAYDAMTSERPYRKAYSHTQAVAELKRCAGIQFDPEMVPTFIQVIENR